MSNSVYVTFDNIDFNTGAGKVCLHETRALAAVTDLKMTIERRDIYEASKYAFNPFLYDYFTAWQLQNRLSSPVDLLHLSCSPGTDIVRSVKPRKYCVNIVAHDLANSIREHEKYYGEGSYPFIHNTDPHLHSLLLAHAVVADGILTPSSASAAWIKQHIRESRVYVIPHGVDLPAETWPLPPSFTAGYLGAYGPDKGLPYMLLAWKHFNRGKLLMAGTCCQAFDGTDKDGWRWIQGVPNYSLMGWVKEISEFYRNISVYIQPSVTEGFGIEVLEAMAYGRPVIVTSGVGAADCVTDGVNGFIVPSRDPQAILEKLNWLYDNPLAIREMGHDARERARDFTWDKIEDKYKEFYTELLK